MCILSPTAKYKSWFNISEKNILRGNPHISVPYLPQRLVVIKQDIKRYCIWNMVINNVMMSAKTTYTVLQSIYFDTSSVCDSHINVGTSFRKF